MLLLLCNILSDNHTNNNHNHNIDNSNNDDAAIIRSPSISSLSSSSSSSSSPSPSLSLSSIKIFNILQESNTIDFPSITTLLLLSSSVRSVFMQNINPHKLSRNALKHLFRNSDVMIDLYITNMINKYHDSSLLSSSFILPSVVLNPLQQQWIDVMAAFQSINHVIHGFDSYFIEDDISTLSKEIALKFFSIISNNINESKEDLKILFKNSKLLAYTCTFISLKIIVSPDSSKVISKISKMNAFTAKDVVKAEMLLLSTLKVDVIWSPSSIFKQKLIEVCSMKCSVTTRSNRNEFEKKQLFDYIEDSVMTYIGLCVYLDVEIDSLLKTVAIILVTIILAKIVDDQSKHSPQNTTVKYVPMKNTRPFPAGISLLQDFNETSSSPAISPIASKRYLDTATRDPDTSLVLSLLILDFHKNNKSCQGAINIISIIFHSIIRRINEDNDNQYYHNDLITNLKKLKKDTLSKIEIIIKKSITLKFEEWR